MEEFFSLIVGIVWIIIIISVFTKVAKKANQNNRNNPQAQRQVQQASMPQRREQTASSGSAVYSDQTFRSVPGSTYGTTRNIQQLGANSAASRNSGYGQGAFAPTNTRGKVKSSARKDTISGTVYSSTRAGGIRENSVLLEDRRNDWLARQLREEAAIKRRGSIYDLGAAHDVSCDADNIRRSHARRHNSNGLNKQMFK